MIRNKRRIPKAIFHEEKLSLYAFNFRNVLSYSMILRITVILSLQWTQHLSNKPVAVGLALIPSPTASISFTGQLIRISVLNNGRTSTLRELIWKFSPVFVSPAQLYQHKSYRKQTRSHLLQYKRMQYVNHSLQVLLYLNRNYR